MLRANSVMDVYSPSRPMPAGPSSNAIALVRTTLHAMSRTDDAPINAEDLSTSWYELLGLLLKVNAGKIWRWHSGYTTRCAQAEVPVTDGIGTLPISGRCVSADS